jgi:hypothetical protein
MLFNLDFLNTGEIWPPRSENERLEEYEENTNIYNCEWEKVDDYKENFKRIKDYMDPKNKVKIITLPLARDYTEKAVNLTWNNVEFNSIDSNNWDILIEKWKESQRDIIRYGCTVINKFINVDGNWDLNIIKPQLWFPVVEIDNIKNIKYHVIAYPSVYKGKDVLKIEIHSKNEIVYKTKLLKYDYIGAEIEELTKQVDIKDWDVYSISNTNDIYGRSEYEDLNDSMIEIFVRLSQTSFILDKHACPILSVPESAATPRRDGSWFFKMTNILLRKNNTDPQPEFITWDGKLENSEKMLEFYFKQYYAKTLGASIMGSDAITVANISSDTLREFNKIAITKINNFRTIYKVQLKKILETITGEEFEVEWEDLFTDTEKETMERMKSRLETGTISKVRAIMILENCTFDEANIIYQEILNENKNSDNTKEIEI